MSDKPPLCYMCGQVRTTLRTSDGIPICYTCKERYLTKLRGEITYIKDSNVTWRGTLPLWNPKRVK